MHDTHAQTDVEAAHGSAPLHHRMPATAEAAAAPAAAVAAAAAAAAGAEAAAAELFYVKRSIHSS
jgi:hypothetical protein